MLRTVALIGMAGSHLLLPVILCSILCSSSFSHRGQCRWRFEDCNRIGQDADCVVRLRCGCFRNESCSSNSSLEVNATTARTLLSSMDKRCNMSTCAVRPQKCQWTPWTLYHDTCLLKMHERFRARCCHPVHRTPINTSMYPALDTGCDLKPQRQQRSKVRFFSDCVILPVDPPRIKDSSDEWSEDFYAAVIAIFVFVGFMALCCGYFGKGLHQNPKVLPDAALLNHSNVQEETFPPATVIVPQPGLPMSEAQPLTQ